MQIETALADFLCREAALPPYPGACCKMADNWVLLVKGFSPLASYGRDFETDDDVRVWLGEPGGIAVAVNRVMRGAGFARTNAPQLGDVGLVIHGDHGNEKIPISVAIRAPHGWHTRNSAGLMLLPPDSLWKAWSI